MGIRYTDEFKIGVIRDYYTNELGVRQTANKWGLPSKNYITKWEEYLKRKGILFDVPKKPALRAAKSLSVKKLCSEDATELNLLRRQNEELKAALEFEQELNKRLGLKKNKK